MFSKKVKFAALFLAIQLIGLTALLAQTNLFTAQQDIEMGRALSRAAGTTFVPSDDSSTRAYVRSLGNELAARAPGFKYPYQFEIFIDPEARSLALPGGFIYLSSGLVMAAQNETELAALLAHQIGHVAARHGTQQVSAEYSRQTNARRPSVTDAISRLRLSLDTDSTVFNYTVQNEQQADTIATQLMYNTRFDPRQIPTAFRRLEDDPDDSARPFLTNHPAQANRLASIRRELQRLGPLPNSWRGDSSGFRAAQDALRGETPFGLASRVDRDESRPVAASSRMATYQGSGFEIRYPDNWRIDDRSGGVMVAPDGGIVNGALAYGMLMDTFTPDTRSKLFGRQSFNVPGGILDSNNVSSATDQLIDELRRSNPNMRVVRKTSKRIDGFEALMVELNNDSPVGGTEVNMLTTVLRSDGFLYYFMGVSPQADINQYSPVFDRMTASVRFY
jgi:Zn-dependent protease with chaperone function